MDIEKIRQEEYIKIRNDPYKYICNWMEDNLICVGGQTFKILSLLPMSLFLPNIPFNSTSIRATMNALLIGNKGSGKSTICKKFGYLTYNPLIRRSISSADLSREANDMKWLSVIIEDFSETIEAYGYEVIKVLEGIIGDEQTINKSNMQVQYTGETKGIGLLGITPQDLDKYAKSMETGLLSRCIVVFIKLKPKDHIIISDYVNLNAGDIEKESMSKIIEETVVEFYEELRFIQRGKHDEFFKNREKEGKIINPIKGYRIEMRFKEAMNKKWRVLSQKMTDKGLVPNVRDLTEYYRFLISSAFLNINKREHKEGILVPNDEDHKLALDLMVENVQYKLAIPMAINSNKRISNLDSLEKFINQGLPEIVRDVLINISPYGKYLKET